MSKSNTSKKGLRRIIVGCGKVGITLTEQLAKEGHDITLIDKNAQKLQATAGMYDVMGVVGIHGVIGVDGGNAVHLGVKSAKKA